MDTDGVLTGFDCDLTRAVSRRHEEFPSSQRQAAQVSRNVFSRVLTEGEADAALAASIFHYETYKVSDLKEYLGDREGIPVRKT